jgi:DNA gyrase subunit B
MTDQKPVYTEENIIKLKPLDHVRLRPGMYFGGTDQRALHSLIFEIVENAIDQAIGDHCSQIQVTLLDNNSVSISDNGPGIPVEKYQDTGLSILETILTTVGGRHLNLKTGNFRGGMFGVGLAAVNAVSSELVIQVNRDGYFWEQKYGKGIPQSNLSQVRTLAPDESTGTCITFTPDFTVFEKTDFDYVSLYRRLKELAYLVRGVVITLEDRRTQRDRSNVVFNYPNGVASFVEHLNRDHKPLHSPISIKKVVELTKNAQPLEYTALIEIAF